MNEIQAIILMAVVICLTVYAIYIFATEPDEPEPESAPEKPFTDEKLHRKDSLLKETIVLLAADLYETFYTRLDSTDYHVAVDKIISHAEEFERRLDWQEDDERDYIEELEKYEQEIKDNLG